MISHFNLSGGNSSFYFTISKILSTAGGLLITGIVGDGSAESLFEARIAEQLQVSVLPTWGEGSDSLCQRYDQELIEQELVSCFQEVSFRSEKAFDPDIGCWRQNIVATPKSISPSYLVTDHMERPHPQVRELAATWQRQRAC